MLEADKSDHHAVDVNLDSNSKHGVTLRAEGIERHGLQTFDVLDERSQGGVLGDCLDRVHSLVKTSGEGSVIKVESKPAETGHSDFELVFQRKS